MTTIFDPYVGLDSLHGLLARDEVVREAFGKFCTKIGFVKDGASARLAKDARVTVSFTHGPHSSSRFIGLRIDCNPPYGLGPELPRRTFKFPVDGAKLKAAVEAMEAKYAELMKERNAEDAKERLRVAARNGEAARLAAGLAALDVDASIYWNVQDASGLVKITLYAKDVDHALAFAAASADARKLLKD